MSGPSSLFPLYALIIWLIEFGFKSLFETFVVRGASHPWRVYLIYRLTTLVCTCTGLGFLFSAPFLRLTGTALLVTAAASSELVTALANRRAFTRFGRVIRPLHFVYLLLFAGTVYASWDGSQWLPGEGIRIFDRFWTLLWLGKPPSADLPWHTAFIYFLATVPVNYAIRWLMNKPTDAALPEIVAAFPAPTGPSPATERLTSEVAVTDALSLNPSTLQAGRVIGVLERWLVLFLLGRGEMGAVGFVFAAKSIVRFREFERRDFAEYYLIGTLYSIVFALVLSSFL